VAVVVEHEVDAVVVHDLDVLLEVVEQEHQAGIRLA